MQESSGASSRTLREVTLEESIRYRPGDQVESWLNRLLCLDVTNGVQALHSGCPPPEQCDLYYINRDTLFSYHRASESFLQRIVSLFVASHYKNSPNDLQMMSDAPAHHLFCLLGPTKGDSLPEVLCAIQVCLEGEISKKSIMSGLSRGQRASGDLIPWTMVQQYQDYDFPRLSGARVVRIATHPDYQRMGYGSRAMQLLTGYYEGKMQSLDEEKASEVVDKIESVEEDDVLLLEESLSPRKNLPPLLLRLSERPPERLDYLGVSFGLTQTLFKFWKRLGFVPTYVRQTANDLTGEHSTIVLRVLSKENPEEGIWLEAFESDFRKRIVNLMGNELMRKFPSTLALNLIMVAKKNSDLLKEVTIDEVKIDVSAYDLSRLEMYANNMADYHLVLDLLPALSRLFFLRRLSGSLGLSPTQKVLLVGLGLQRKTVDQLSDELELPASQLLALFNRMMRKFTKALKALYEESIAASLGVKELPKAVAAIEENMEKELEEAGKEAVSKLQFEELNQYRIKGDEQEWSKALSGKGSKVLVSVKSGEKRLGEDIDSKHHKKVKKVKKKK